MKKVVGWIVVLVIVAVVIGLIVIKGKKPESATAPESTSTSSAAAPAAPAAGTPATRPSEESSSATPGKTPATSTEAENEASAESPGSKLPWNKTDPGAFTNGNMKLASGYLRDGGTADGRIRPDAAAVTKAPTEYYGQTLCFSGTVAANEDAGEQAQKLLKADSVAEVVLRHADGSVLDYFLIDEPAPQAVGSTAAFCGLPVGVAEVDNGKSGKSTQLILVGKSNHPQ